MRRLCLAIALALVPPGAGAQTEDYLLVGHWDVFYEPLKGGCGAITPLENYSAFMMGLHTLTGELMLDVAIMNPAWASIVAGQDYVADVQFDDNPPMTLTMRGDYWEPNHGLKVVFHTEDDASKQFARQFMAAERMRWTYRGADLGTYGLPHARQVFEAMVACTDLHLEKDETTPTPAPLDKTGKTGKGAPRD